MRQIIRPALILALAVIGIGFSNEMLKRPNPPIAEDEDEQEFHKPKAKRRPASVPDVIQKNPVSRPDLQVTSSPSDDRNFEQNADLPEASHQEAPSSGGNSGYQSVYGDGSSSYGRRSGGTNPSGNNSTGRATEPSSNNGTQMNGGMVFSNVGNSPSTNTSTGNGTSSSSSNRGSSSSSSPPVDNLTCSPSTGGGAFGNPIQVSITCTAAADIKYCLQDGVCCDPETEGTSYSGPIVIGAEDGNFCLSFYGETAAFKVSNVVQQSYTINNTFPDVQVSFNKIFYQTTQLAGEHYLRSNDFSKSNYWIGEINLKANDPGPLGLNMDCQDIVENYVTLPAPTPATLFTQMHMAPIAFGLQLNVPLQLSKLIYGDNFLTSYVLNDNFAAPLYSCSTNKLTLSDFEFFAAEASHGETGTNQVREFSGSFVAYGFFEPDATVYRGPAGAATEDDSGQELRLGSFGIFY